MRILIIIISFPCWVSAQLNPNTIEDYCVILNDSTLKTWGLDKTDIFVLPNFTAMNEVRNLAQIFGNSPIQNLDSILKSFENQYIKSSKKEKIMSRKTIKNSCLSMRFLISKKRKSKWLLSISEKIQCENQFVYFFNIYINPKQSQSMFAELIWLLIYDSDNKLQKYYFVEVIS